jgi:hypothetical protein
MVSPERTHSGRKSPCGSVKSLAYLAGGSALFTWGDGDSLSRELTMSGFGTTLSVSEYSTDSYGFGESGEQKGSELFFWTTFREG